MSSSSFGSAFMVWGEMPIEYIDHIEVYKGSSSVEFGNEVASTIIKLYTKKAQRVKYYNSS
jgi:iron complex outermembrane receptor protein